MKAPVKISDFEKELDPKLAERGFNFWQSQALADLVRVDESHWKAIVWGSITYEVHISIDKDSFSHWNCNCPNDHEDICKHIIAVLYALRHHYTNSSEAAPNTRRQDLDSLLSQVAIDDLINFIRERALTKKGLYLSLLAYFGESSQSDQLKIYYNRTISENARLYLLSEEDEYSVDNLPKFMKPIEKLLQTAEVYIKENQYKLALPICQAIIEELSEIQLSLKGTSRLEDATNNAFQLIAAISRSRLDDAMKERIRSYAQIEMQADKYQELELINMFEHILKDI